MWSGIFTAVLVSCFSVHVAQNIYIVTSNIMEHRLEDILARVLRIHPGE